MTKKLSVFLAGTLLLFGLVYVFRLENIGTSALWNLSDGGKWLLPLIARVEDVFHPGRFCGGLRACGAAVGLVRGDGRRGRSAYGILSSPA